MSKSATIRMSRVRYPGSSPFGGVMMGIGLGGAVAFQFLLNQAIVRWGAIPR